MISTSTLGQSQGLDQLAHQLLHVPPGRWSEAEKASRRLKRAAAEQLALELMDYVPAKFHPHGFLAFWRGKDGKASVGRVLIYSSPDVAYSPPWVLRISLNQIDVRVPMSTLRALGIPDNEWHWIGSSIRSNTKLELNVLPGELPEFLRWTAAYVAHFDRDLSLPNPPLPIEGRPPYDGSYLWSSAAAAEYDHYRDRRKKGEEERAARLAAQGQAS